MNDLIAAIKDLHGCNAEYSESTEVKETFKGQTVWEGVVHTFTVDHPDTDKCYAWSHPVEGTKQEKYYAVLHLPHVDSPLAAVRASIVAENQ